MAAGKLAKWVPVGSLRQPFIYIYIICIWMVCVLNHFHLPLVAVINSQCTCVLKSPNPWLVHPSISTEHAMLTKSSMDWDDDTDPTYVRCCETG